MTAFLRRIRPETLESYDADRRSNSAVERDDSFSRHSSIQGPYREGLDTSFPVYCTIKSQFRAPSVYNRSMLSLGNGVGIFHVEGNIARPKYHFSQGAFLGDVGYLTDSGTFCYCFNIFHPPDHPIQVQNATLPANFSPVDPPLSTDDVRTTPNYFPPGTILGTEGIQPSRTSDSPLKVEFVTNAREGAVLVLPTGTTREELVNPSLIHAYVRDNAVSWYQLFNGKDDDIIQSPIANGTVWVVTSVDRADSWALATFPSQDIGLSHSKKETRFTYDAENTEFPWKGSGETRPLRYKAEHAPEGTVGAVLLGVQSVALSPLKWKNNVAYIPPDSVRSCPVLSLPTLGLQGRLRRIFDYLIGTIKPPMLENPVGDFHPSAILLQILLLSDPSALVGVIDDSVWTSQLNKRLLTHPEVVGLIQRVFDSYDVVNMDGLVTLTLKDLQETPAVASTRSQKKRDLFPGFRILTRISKKSTEDPKSLIRQNMAKVLWMPEERL